MSRSRASQRRSLGWMVLFFAAVATGCRASRPAPGAPVPATPVPLVGAAAGSGILPIARLTPGAADPRVTQDNIASTICVPGYSTRVRPPEAVTERIKVQVMVTYGLGHDLADYELDHLISLELGGAPADVRNLWPEPWERAGSRLAAPGTGAESKDQLENLLHHDVCDGHLSLADAQRSIATNWLAAYHQDGLTPRE